MYTGRAGERERERVSREIYVITMIYNLNFKLNMSIISRVLHIDQAYILSYL